MGCANGGCGGAEFCGANTEVCGEAGAEACSLLGVSVDAEEESSFGGNTENGHGAVCAVAANGVEAVGNAWHFFKGDANSACGGPCGVGEVTDGCNGGSGKHDVS